MKGDLNFLVKSLQSYKVIRNEIERRDHHQEQLNSVYQTPTTRTKHEVWILTPNTQQIDVGTTIIPSPLQEATSKTVVLEIT